MDDADFAPGSLPVRDDADGTTDAEPDTVTFAEWRAARPFWPGLVMILGGLAIAWPAIRFALAASLVESQSVVTLGVPLGALVVFAGVGAMVRPARARPLGLVGVVLSTLSFVVVFGGVFFLGLILGGVGGVLAFAWEPSAGAALATETDDENEETD